MPLNIQPQVHIAQQHIDTMQHCHNLTFVEKPHDLDKIISVIQGYTGIRPRDQMTITCTQPRQTEQNIFRCNDMLSYKVADQVPRPAMRMARSL